MCVNLTLRGMTAMWLLRPAACTLRRRTNLATGTSAALALVMLAVLCGCRDTSHQGPAIGVAFETLQTEYWVASFDALQAELERRDIEMVPAIADNDANRQLDQIHTFIARRVDGIIVSPKDATTVIPMMRAANEAGIPIVIYNRPPAESAFQAVTVVADNYELAKATVNYMVQRARETGRQYKAMLLIGDLGDQNAIARRDGFEDAVREHSDVVDVVARVPTEWSQDVARAGVINALQAHPDIDFIFTSSDFLLPSLVAALKEKDKYKRVDEPGHILLGGFDGDSMAYQMLVDGYLDACGVQDVYFECAESVEAILKTRRHENVGPVVRDPGFVIHQDNLREKESQMWGAKVARQRRKS